jgi:phosphatidylglycerophosphate synthase
VNPAIPPTVFLGNPFTDGGPVRTIRAGLLIGVLALTALLVALVLTAGLGPAGLAAGAAYALVGAGLVARGLRRCGRRSLGPADLITLARAVLVGGVTALVAHSVVDHDQHNVLLAFLAAAALVLDGVDGEVARRTGTASDFGARFDVEVDSFLVLVLAVAAAQPLGAWVLAIGIPHYLLLVARRVWPWLRGPLPARRWCKVVAVVQGVTLLAVGAEVLPRAAGIVALGLVAALLIESFGREVIWLWRAQRRETRSAVRAAEAASVGV